MKKLIIILIFAFSAAGSQAQLEVGLFAGGSYYVGDLNPAYPFLQTTFSYGGVARYNFNNRWTVKLNLLKGRLLGDDLKSNFLAERELKFESDLYEGSVVMEFNFLPYFTGSKKNYYTPYIFGGLGLFYSKPQIGGVDLRDMGTEGQYYSAYTNINRPEYNYINLAIPFGVGFKYSFSKRICVSLEWGMRKTFTDYLDDVSTTYYLPGNQDPPPNDENYTLTRLLYSDPNRNHQPLQQRGNEKTNDWYSFAGMTITYNINLSKKNKCTDFEDN
jgi:hypothetical protein